MVRQANLFLNGAATLYSNKVLDRSQYTLAADGGVIQAVANGIRPAAIIGDGDSAILSDYPDIPYISTPDQDFTDFEKALDYLAQNGYTHIRVYCFQGDRFDHMVAGLSAVVARPQLNIELFTQTQKVLRLPPHYQATMSPGTCISLLPFPQAVSVTTEGLKWNLSKNNFILGQSISISNQVKDCQIKISYYSGSLFLVVSL